MKLKELVVIMQAELPKRCFGPQPRAALIDIPCLAVIGFCFWALVHYEMPWYACLGISFIVANTIPIMAFLAHETLHGSVFRNRVLQDIIGHIGFSYYFISPTLWRYWHNYVHHGHTNKPDADPDSSGTYERFKKVPIVQYQARTAIGSGHWASYLFLLHRFTFQGQIVLWLASRKLKGFETMNRKKVLAETFFMFFFWIGLAVLMGPKAAFFGILLPMPIANFVLMGYIATNHMMRPLTDRNQVMINSMSVKVPAWVDFLHLNFSHHVEHHIFPHMSFLYTPVVRRYLLKYMPEQYACMPYWKAIYYLHKTPRIYLDHYTLFNPYTDEKVDIRELEMNFFGHWIMMDVSS